LLKWQPHLDDLQTVVSHALAVDLDLSTSSQIHVLPGAGAARARAASKARIANLRRASARRADSDDCGHLFRLKADSDSDRSRTAFR
jgi:hypothetical protein